jgi:hypothetical protein
MKLIGINELAQLTGKRRQSIRPVLEAAGIEATPGPHRAKLYPSDRALAVLYLGTDKLDGTEQRARLDKARADLAELQLAERRGALVPKADVTREWQDILRVFTARITSLPVRVATLCGATPDERVRLQTEATRHVHDALTELGTPPGELYCDRYALEEFPRPDGCPAGSPDRAAPADDGGGAVPGRGRARAARPAPAPDR